MDHTDPSEFVSTVPSVEPAAAYPRIIQGSLAPVFRCGNTGHFACSNCDLVLIDRYEPRCFAAVDIECFRCRAVSRTPPWPDNEPLPSAAITLGSHGKFLMTGTVDAAEVTLTCDQEIERVRRIVGVLPSPASSFELTDAGLNAVEATLGVMCKSFATCLARTRVAEARGNFAFMKFPPAWALQRLRRCAQERQIAMHEADGVALAFLQMTLSLLERWKNHPRFAFIADALLHEFHHSIAQLIAASYLSDIGNRIGFDSPSAGGGRTPDMFVNLDALERLSLEVKAPQAWQWPRGLPSVDQIARVVEERSKQSRGQIGQGGGVLVLGASIAAPQFASFVREALGAVKVPSRIAAVALVNLRPNPSMRANAPGRVDVQAEAEVFAVPNSRFNGRNPVVL